MENNLKNTMTYRAYYSDKSIPKEHNKGLGIPKVFAGGLRASTMNFFNRLKSKNKVENVEYKQWKEIIDTSNKKISEAILNNELGFKLPFNLGFLRILGFKSGKKKYSIFKKGKKSIAHNLHSFGYIYSVKWIKGVEVRFKYKDIMCFDASRDLNRGITPQVYKEFPFIKT